MTIHESISTCHRKSLCSKQFRVHVFRVATCVIYWWKSWTVYRLFLENVSTNRCEIFTGYFKYIRIENQCWRTRVRTRVPIIKDSDSDSDSDSDTRTRTRTRTPRTRTRTRIGWTRLQHCWKLSGYYHSIRAKPMLYSPFKARTQF